MKLIFGILIRCEMRNPLSLSKILCRYVAVFLHRSTKIVIKIPEIKRLQEKQNHKMLSRIFGWHTRWIFFSRLE